jgi:hypothetical protein
MLALTTYSLYDWDKRSVPAEAACATRVQVVAGRAAFAEPLRTSIVVTPRGAVGFRGHGHADRASAAVSRVVNARVCRKHTHASGQEQWAWQREAKAGSESGERKRGAMPTLVAPVLAHGVGHASRHSNEQQRDEPHV